MSLDSREALQSCVEKGVYSTYMSAPRRRGKWESHHEATFADYVTMRPGDNIYFFIKREIYGIGELIPIGGTRACCFLNYPQASDPEQLSHEDIESRSLLNEGGKTAHYRWVCFFKPTPHFFRNGLDMDDMLSSNPSAFRMLRVFWKRSFLKFDDDENQAFKDALLKANQRLLGETKHADIFVSNQESVHQEIASRVSPQYYLDAKPFLSACASGAHLGHEMALELALLAQINSQHSATTAVFGRWDYLHHQVVASPFKPVDYMDKMDVFGYSFLNGLRPTKARYLICELKKKRATVTDAEQLMKYVDWVKDEYAFGDYSMINAFLVASSFDRKLMDDLETISLRRYIVGRRPAVSGKWNNLTAIKYTYDRDSGLLDFLQVRPDC